MLATTLVLAGLLSQKQPKLKTYHDKDMDLSFQYPGQWGLRRERHWTVVDYRSSTGHNVHIQFLPTYFRQTSDTWQQLQVDVAKGRGETVTNQSVEEILGVPLLLTRVTHDEKGVQTSVWTGLIFAKTDQKLNFRVTSDISDASESEQDWRNVLLTLRTGEAPKPEDNGKLEPKKPKADDDQVPDGPPIKWVPKSGMAVRPVRAPLRVKLGDSGYVAYTPPGWIWDKNTLTRPGFRGALTVKVGAYSPEQIDSLVLKTGAEELSRTISIQHREEIPLGTNKAGYKVHRVIRLVTTANGQRVMIIWGGQSDVFGWMLTYEGTQLEEKQDRTFMESLVNSMSVESSS